MTTCRTCLVDKPVDDFHLRRDTGRRRSQCKTCWRVITDQWSSSNPDGRKAIANRYSRANGEIKRAWKRRNPVAAKRWDRENPDLVRSMKNGWKRRNPHKILADVRARQAARLRATPAWADLKAIEAIYADARRRGLEVDHVVPLRSRKVCGLHVESNLEPLSKVANRSKGNRTWPDMP